VTPRDHTTFDANLAYRQTLRIRMVEEAIAAEYPNQEMRCPVHLSIGQEAVAVGVGMALQPSDWAFSAHRSHAHYLAKGGDLKGMLSEIYGRSDGCVGGRGGSMHLSDLDCGFMAATPIVGSTIPIAVGAALTAQLRGEDRVVVAFFGEAAIETGVLHESINFACVRKLPVLFVCENNLYSVYSPMSVRQPLNRTPSDAAGGHGIRLLTADGNDVRAVREATKEAVTQARIGNGPSFLEFPTYRYRQHCGPDFDDHLLYRDIHETEQWAKRDPVLIALSTATEGGSKVDAEVIRNEIAGEINSAFTHAKNAPLATPKTSAHGVFA
jgi:TPP-dependent pyruvate/acetoin dehydrogenase alpha subunit